MRVTDEQCKVMRNMSLTTAGVMEASEDLILNKEETHGPAPTTTAAAEVEAMVSKVASLSDDTMLYKTATGFMQAFILNVFCFQWLVMWTQARWRASRRRVRAWGAGVLGRLVAGITLACLLNNGVVAVVVIVWLLLREPLTFENYRREHFMDDHKALLAWNEKLCAQSELLDAMVVKVRREANSGMRIGGESGIVVHGRLLQLQADTNALKARIAPQVTAAKLVFGDYL